MQIFQNDAVLLERYQKKQSFQTLPMDTIENATVVDSVSFYGVKCTKVRSSLCCLRLRVVRIPMQQHQIPIMRTKCRMLYTTLLTTYQVKSAMGFFFATPRSMCRDSAEKAGAEAKIESESYRASLT